MRLAGSSSSIAAEQAGQSARSPQPSTSEWCRDVLTAVCTARMSCAFLAIFLRPNEDPSKNTAAPLLSIIDCMIFLRHHITPPHPRWGSTQPFLIPIATMYSTWGRFSAMMPMPPLCTLYRPQGQKGLHRPAPHPPRSTEARNLQQHPNAPAVNTSSPQRGASWGHLVSRWAG